MAAPGDIFGPQQPIDMGVEEPAADPWSWVPASWLDVATPAQDTAAFAAPPVEPPPPQPVAGVQPGLGIPTQTVDDTFETTMAGYQTGDTPVVLPWVENKLGVDFDKAPPPEQVSFEPEEIEGKWSDEGLPTADRIRARVKWAETDPEGYAAATAEEEAAAERERTRLELEQARRDEERATRNQQMREEAFRRAQQTTAEIDAEAKNIANTKVDTGRWWASRSTGQKIAGFLSAIIGGLYQGRTGAPNNQGLDAINRAIDQDIDAQVRDLSNRREALGMRRGLVADEYERTGDIYRAAETARLAARERYAIELEAEMQNYDPRGTTVRRMVPQILAWRAQNRELAAKMEAERAERDLKAWEKRTEVELKLAQQKEQERHNKKQESLDGWRIQVDRDDKRDGRTLEARKLEMEAKKLEAEGKKKEAELVRTRAIGFATGKVVKDEKGDLVPEFGTLTNADGSTYIPPTDKEAEELRKKKAAVDDVNAWVSEIAREIDEYGGETAWLKSGSYQRRISDMGFIKEKIRAGAGMGALDDGTDKAIAAMLGGGNVNSHFHDAITGIKQGAKNLTRQFNTDLRAAQYTGADYIPPDLSRTGAARSPQDAALKKSLGWQTDNSMFGKSHDVIRSIMPAGTPGEVVEEQARGFTVGQQQEIDALAATASGTGEAAQNAKAKLKVFATKADSPGLRSYAKAAQEKVTPESKAPTDEHGTPLHVPDVSRFKDG